LSYIRRSFALIAVSLAMYGLGGGCGRIGEFEEMPEEFQPRRAFASAPAPELFDQVYAEMATIKDPTAPPEADLANLSADEKAARLKTFEDQKKAVADQRAAIQKKYADVASAERASFTDAEVERRASFEALPTARNCGLAGRRFAEAREGSVWRRSRSSA
jgi:hypothetical protein